MSAAKYKNRNTQYCRNWRAKRETVGLCIRCGKDKAREGFKECDPCAQKQRAASRRYRQTLSILKGLGK